MALMLIALSISHHKADRWARCLSLWLFWAFNLFSILLPLHPLPPRVLSPSLRRFGIKTAVTQSKTVKVKLPSRCSALGFCLNPPPQLLHVLNLFRRTGDKKVITQKKAWDLGSRYAHMSSVWHLSQTKVDADGARVAPAQCFFLFPAAASPSFSSELSSVIRPRAW